METLKETIIEALKVKALTFAEIEAITEANKKELKFELLRLRAKNAITLKDKVYSIVKEKAPTKVVSQIYELADTCLNVSEKGSGNLKVVQVDSYGNENVFVQKFTPKEGSNNMIFGTAINRLFEYVELLRDCNGKGNFKSTLPIKVEIEFGDCFISTENMSKANQDALKIGYTAKRKRIFARKIYTLCLFVTSTPKDIEYTELDKIWAEIEASEAETRKASK